MNLIKGKIKKTEILIRARKVQLQQETKLLMSIRDEKLQHLKELEQYQKSYISGIDTLNHERSSPNRSRLQTLEKSVDHSKSQWYRSMRQVKELEQKEKAQIQQVLVAQRNLKSIEIIRENYHTKLNQELKQQEQKTIDEFSTNQFGKGS